MVRKSYGKKRRTRHKLTLKKRVTITHYLEQFQEGDRVHVQLSTNKHLPHPKFHGRTGVVLGARGRAYIVAVPDHAATKQIIVRPEHLRKA